MADCLYRYDMLVYSSLVYSSLGDTDVSINWGDTPQWMVYFMENPIKIGNIDDLGLAMFQDP